MPTNVTMQNNILIFSTNFTNIDYVGNYLLVGKTATNGIKNCRNEKKCLNQRENNSITLRYTIHKKYKNKNKSIE